jgi:hypothetical protein
MLQKGQEYQDYVMMKLHAHGIVLQCIQSKKFQLKRENLLGLEIKFDDRMKETGNIYFETAEKSDPANREFIDSGILRDDENWLYGVGDYSQIFIFSKGRLQNIYSHLLKAREERRQPSIAGTIRDGIKAGTSRGFTLPISAALTICEKYIDLSTPPHGGAL